jgi:hypothetical protein
MQTRPPIKRGRVAAARTSRSQCCGAISAGTTHASLI